MPANYLEQMIAEWYEYRGYFVRQNVMVGKRVQGGYTCELDIVALHPGEKRLVHVEPSMDCDKWETRETRFRKKFAAGRRYIPELFMGMDLPDEIEQVAVLVYASKVNHTTIGGGKIMLVSEVLAEIFADLRHKRLDKDAIPEHLTILRSFQFVAQYRKTLRTLWDE